MLSRLVWRCSLWQRGSTGAAPAVTTAVVSWKNRRKSSSVAAGGSRGHDDGAEPVTRGVRTSASMEELKNEDKWLQDQVVAYYQGKNRLAEMMGQDPSAFTQEDIDEAIRYLLPTRLTAKDARPMMKHPFSIFAKRQASAFDSSGRPLQPGFYTGTPSYSNLIFEIYKCRRSLVEAEDKQWLQASNKEEDVDEKVLVKELGQDALSEDQEDAVPMTTSPAPPPAMKWVKKSALANMLAEEISDAQYDEVISRLNELSDHPLSNLISEFLDQYRRPVFAYRSLAKLPQVNAQGYAYSVGRRKTSMAQVWVKEGDGNVTINGRALNDYFPLIEQRHQVLYPFLLLGQLEKYSVRAKVKGGGQHGQAGAVRLGISRALLAFPGDHGDILEKEGLLIRDPRMVERKKPGQKKARKKFAWVKR